MLSVAVVDHSSSRSSIRYCCNRLSIHCCCYIHSRWYSHCSSLVVFQGWEQAEVLDTEKRPTGSSLAREQALEPVDCNTAAAVEAEVELEYTRVAEAVVWKTLKDRTLLDVGLLYGRVQASELESH